MRYIEEFRKLSKKDQEEVLNLIRFKNEIKKQDLKEENKRLKSQMKQAIDLLYSWGEILYPEFQKKMLQILENGDK